MSLILEALRRAERERRADGGLRPSPVGNAAKAPLRSRTPLILVGTLGAAAVLASALGFLLVAKDRPRPLVVVAERSPSPATPPVGAARRPPDPEASPGAARVEASPRSSPGDLPLRVPVAPSPVRLPVLAKVPLADLDQGAVPLAPPRPPAAEAATAAPVPPPVPPRAPAPILSPSVELPLVQDLPAQVRERIGRLEVNAHVYAEDPAERFVFINGKACRVGDRIGTGGVVLERITPDGAVIDYGGGRALLEAER